LITFAPLPAAAPRLAVMQQVRRDMTDRTAIIETMAADVVRIRQRNDCVLRDDILREGWTDAQVDRFSNAAIARAKEIEADRERGAVS